jgi:hypothetical protein
MVSQLRTPKSSRSPLYNPTVSDNTSITGFLDSPSCSVDNTRMMDKIQKTRDFNGNIPISEPFRFVEKINFYPFPTNIIFYNYTFIQKKLQYNMK